MRSILILSSVLVFGMGCSNQSPDVDSKAQSKPLTQVTVPKVELKTKKPIVSKIVPEGKAPFEKKVDETSKVNVKKIDWAQVDKFPKLDQAMIPEFVPKTLKGLPVPVLFPANPTMIKSAKITRGANWYAASMDDGEHQLYVQGARTSFEFAKIELTKKGDDLTKKPFLITRTHQIVTISFERFGAGYGIDIECRKPMTDPRCTKDAYAHKLMKMLGVVDVGGQR